MGVREGVGYLGHKYRFIVYCPHFPYAKYNWEEKLSLTHMLIFLIASLTCTDNFSNID